MKIFYYCQHILGMGHFFRSLEICKALSSHTVHLITGGPDIGMPLPSHIIEHKLPGLVSDPEFNGLKPIEPGRTIDDVKKERQKILYELFDRERPDVFLIELFPFGRNAFRFELNPILNGLRSGSLPPCRAVCSLRDILVEKKKQAEYEQRVLNHLNCRFDALLVHSDENIIKLDETFSRVREIPVPVFYTGFVTPKPEPGGGKRIRERLGLSEDEPLIVASAGGGNVGYELLEATVLASNILDEKLSHRLNVFTGPFMAQEQFEKLTSQAGNQVAVERFTTDFTAYLDACNCSVSMAGYNTCLNVLSANVRGLVWPFAQNREQKFRVDALSRSGNLSLLTDEDLEPETLARRIASVLRNGVSPVSRINLDGGPNTAAWLESWMKKPWKPVRSKSYASLWLKQPDDLEATLNRAIEAGLDKNSSGRADVFFRADDIGVPSRNFSRLVDIFRRKNTPLAPAVTPAWLTEKRWSELKAETEGPSKLWCWHQHGRRHVNHEPFGSKGEFGPARSKDQLRYDIANGMNRLKKMMGNDFTPIFTPPWNKCSSDALDVMKELGFVAVSRSANAKPAPPADLPDIPISVDLHTRREITPEAAWRELFRELELSLAGERCGIMIHHQRMNDSAFGFLETLIDILSAKKEIRIISMHNLL